MIVAKQQLIRAKLGVTTVIGGLISSEDIKTITKYLILGSIPIFGELLNLLVLQIKSPK